MFAETRQKIRSGLIGLWPIPRYVSASLIVSLAGLLNGIDTGTIGPATQMPAFTETFGQIEPSTLGFVVSSILLGATITSAFSGSLADGLGRTKAISIGAAIYTIGATLEAASMNIAMLIIARLLVGAGQGFFLSTMMVYVCEISPPKHRGILCTCIQLFCTTGITLGFFSCYGTLRISNSLSWRLPFALHAGIALILTIGSIFYLPESPRWLTSRGRNAEAAHIWDILGVSSAEREKESSQLESQAVPLSIQASTPPLPFLARSQLALSTKIHSILSLFRGESRAPILLALFLMTMQQLSGIDAVLYYAPILFSQSGLSPQNTFLASALSAVAILLSTLFATAFANKWGRRPSSIYGGLILLGCMLVMGMMYATNSVHANQGGGRWVIIISIYVFSCVYSMTWAVGMKMYASEIQPTKTRAAGMALSQGANAGANFFVALITPILLSTSTYGAYFLFGGCLLITLIVCVVAMPETKGLELESISDTFAAHKVGDVSVIKVVRRIRSLVVSRVLRRRGYGVREEIEMQ